jgi:hypothetical protein
MNNGKRSQIVEDKYHESIKSIDFIHKCYIECAHLFYDHPYLFWHEFPNQEIKENQRIIFQLIKVGIKNAIKQMLPMKKILEEYLKNDYVSDEQPNFMNVRDMLNKDKLENVYNEGGNMAILESTKSYSSNDDLYKLEQNAGDFAALIYGRQIHDTIDEDTHQSNNKKYDSPMSDNKEVSDKKDVTDDKQVSDKKEESARSDGDSDGDLKKYKKMEELLQNGKGKKNINDKILMDNINAAKGKNDSERIDENSIKMVRGTHSKSDKDNYYSEE